MTREELDDICNQITEGKSLRAICREKGLAESSVRYWLNKDEESFAQTARARELGCDALADECIEIADDKSIDPAHKRLMVETRLKLIGKWSQRYSDKLTVANKTEVTHRYDLDSLSDDQIDELERILAHAGASQGSESPSQSDSVH